MPAPLRLAEAFRWEEAGPVRAAGDRACRQRPPISGRKTGLCAFCEVGGAVGPAGLCGLLWGLWRGARLRVIGADICQPAVP